MGLKVLVTGASGFIGSHVVRHLVDQDAEVSILVRYGNLIKCARLADVWDRLEVIEADLRNRSALQALMNDPPRIVLHLAAYNHVGQSFVQTEECFDVNAKGTVNLLDTLAAPVRAGDCRFVYVSSSEVYGSAPSPPWDESYYPDPISPYAITKFAAERYCHMYQGCGWDIAIVRPFNAYGPAQSSKAVIPELIIAALRGEPLEITSGEQTREFNYVRDIAKGIITAGMGHLVRGVTNLACGQEISIRDLAQKIVQATGSQSKVLVGARPLRPTEIRRMSGDSEKASNELDWRPSLGLDEGLHLTINWYRERLESNESLYC